MFRTRTTEADDAKVFIACGGGASSRRFAPGRIALVPTEDECPHRVGSGPFALTSTNGRPLRLAVVHRVVDVRLLPAICDLTQAMNHATPVNRPRMPSPRPPRNRTKNGASRLLACPPFKSRLRFDASN